MSKPQNTVQLRIPENCPGWYQAFLDVAFGCAEKVNRNTPSERAQNGCRPGDLPALQTRASKERMMYHALWLDEMVPAIRTLLNNATREQNHYRDKIEAMKEAEARG